MSKSTDLLTALTQLRNLIQSGNPPMDCHGICAWLIFYALIPTYKFIDLCHQWPNCLWDTYDSTNHRKSVCFPVVDYRTYMIDKHSGTQWSNPTRLEFIDWAIKHLTQEQVNEKAET